MIFVTALRRIHYLAWPEFMDQAVRQRSPRKNTLAWYRDTFRLLLSFAKKHLGNVPPSLDVIDIDAMLVIAFLDDLETYRSVSVRTRNFWLAAIHSYGC